MSSELACRAVASASRETFHHRDGNDRLLTLRSPLLFRRGEATSAVGLRYCSQDAQSTAKIRFPRASAFRLSTARGEMAELSTPRHPSEDWSPAHRRASSLRAKTFFR